MQLYNLFMKSAPKMEHLKNKTLRFLSDANIITIRPQNGHSIYNFPPHFMIGRPLLTTLCVTN